MLSYENNHQKRQNKIQKRAGEEAPPSILCFEQEHWITRIIYRDEVYCGTLSETICVMKLSRICTTCLYCAFSLAFLKFQGEFREAARP